MPTGDHLDQQLQHYFANYLRDITSTLTEVKEMVYSLIRVHCPLMPPPSISTDLHSLTSACAMTYEDLRKVEVLLRGYLRGQTPCQLPAKHLQQPAPPAS